ncbi:oligosaccharide flippase family protein [Pontibacter sp. G13]|uniref:oligosaccharide flippase family protein n=1 Tax=Pontibacter sp. G13 TaxID=3074898 RepID=UPI002889EB1C|nr:oligosaccharide flippase family protein [Pontibacter sp. G13]WNJ21521.1 oligosaccharide flippase family protein [Pontibacter sp. G13]
MKKSLFANIGVVVLLNLLVKPIWVLTENKVQDVVGHDEFGMYSALLSFGFLFITLADLGINHYTTKTLASEPHHLKAYFPNLLTFKIGLTLLYPFAMVGAGWLMGYEPRKLYLLGVLCLVQGGTLIMEFFRANLRAMQRFKTDGILSVFDRLFLLGLVFILFWVGMDVERFIYARLLTVGVSFILFYALLVKLYGWMRPRFDLPVIKKLVRASLPFATMTILYSVHDKVDQVMLERMASSSENGLYVGAYRWLDAFSMYMWTVLPIFVARFAYFLKDLKEQSQLLRFGQVIVALPMIFVGAWGFFCGEHLLFLFGNSTETELAAIVACMRILFVVLAMNGIFAIFSTLLTSTGHERHVNRMVAASIALNILLNIFLIPRYGALACAWSTLASYLLVNLSYVWYIHRKVDIQVPFLQMGKLLLSGGALFGMFYFAHSLDVHWVWISAICGSVYVGIAWTLGLIRMDMIRKFRV